MAGHAHKPAHALATGLLSRLQRPILAQDDLTLPLRHRMHVHQVRRPAQFLYHFVQFQQELAPDALR